jgi:hypothetical protein
LPADVAIDAEVDLVMTGGAYPLAARLNVSLPGIDRQVTQDLVDAAHQLCSYSNATRGNIEVAINPGLSRPVTDLACPCLSGRPFPIAEGCVTVTDDSR